MKSALINLAEMFAMYVEISWLSYRHKGHTSFHPSCSFCQVDLSIRTDERSRNSYGPGMVWTYTPANHREKSN
jgi:hypothetical protein